MSWSDQVRADSPLGFFVRQHMPETKQFVTALRTTEGSDDLHRAISQLPSAFSQHMKTVVQQARVSHLEDEQIAQQLSGLLEEILESKERYERHIADMDRDTLSKFH